MGNPKPLLAQERGIIVAADVSTLDELRHLAEATASVRETVAVKIGFSLALRFGLGTAVKAVTETANLPVIYDHQKAATDIPAMGQPFAEACREAGVKGVILFPQAGPKTLDAFATAAVEQGLVPIVGLMMTHPAYLQSDGGFVSDDAPGVICDRALDLGVRAFVLPGNRPDVVASYGDGPLSKAAPVEIMMPGIGTQGGSLSAALGAAGRHHCFGIIGSAIYKAPDPRAAVEHFATEIRS